MTRQDAISRLKTDGCYDCAYGCENVVDCTAKGCKYKEAILMAISDLESMDLLSNVTFKIEKGDE